MRVDLAVIGSGFGGSVTALVARRLGLSVALIERDTHPRFAIGESTSPLANLLIETLAHRYSLPRLLPLATWGAWKTAYPQLGVGLKRGFTYFAHRPGAPFGRDPDHADRLAVAASPADPCADTHWLRADVDHFLQREAEASGAHYRDRTTVEGVAERNGRWRLDCRRDGARETVDAGLVIDASGGPGPLARALGIGSVGFAGYPRTEALYTHFAGVRRAADLPDFAPRHPDPYPPDQAALHHVFPGGWMWVLRFDDDTVSAGVACEASLAAELGFSDPERAWSRFLDRFPSVGAQFAGATALRPLTHAPRLAFRMARAAGATDTGAPWALLPSAAGFVDPLYSTGFALTLSGIERLATHLESGFPGPDALAAYEADTFRDLDWVARFIAANYATFDRFPRFVDTSLFYFAAASYAETARRLDDPGRAPGVLLSGLPAFRAAFDAWTQSPDLPVGEAIAPWNVAGLADAGKRNGYGVDLEDLVRGAHRLGIAPERMREVLRDADWARCG